MLCAVVSQVWRVSWNVTGTILAASFDDGYVRLLKGKSSDQQLYSSGSANLQHILITVSEAREYRAQLESNLTSANVNVSLQHGD